LFVYCVELNLYYEARGHISKLCLYSKNYTIIWVVWYTTYCFCPRAARELAHNKSCGSIAIETVEPHVLNDPPRAFCLTV